MAGDMVFTPIPEAPGPRIDRPAAEDPLTQVMVRFAHRALWRGFAYSAGICAVGGVLLFVAEGTTLVLVAGVALFLPGLRQLVLFRALDKVMARQSWRPVTARVFAAEPSHVEVRDGADVYPLKGCVPPFYARVLARHPDTWVVGPDSRGRAALRLPGLHAPLALRKAKNVKGDRVAPRPPRIDPAAAASEDETAHSSAKVMRRHVHGRLYWPLLIASGFPIGFVLVLTTQGTADEDSVAAALVVAAVVLVVLIWALTRWQKFRAFAALPKLLAAGPWQRYPTRLTSAFRPGKYVTDEMSVVVDLDGVELPFTLHHATPDVVGYIEDTRTIWFAGSPHSGGQAVAAGVPGYPILVIARPTPPQSR